MTMLALDWNATRVRALLGEAGDYPLPVPLELPGLELPAALSLAKAALEIGTPALRHCRTAPHFVCQSFLQHLNNNHGPRWQADRHSLDAKAACEHLWHRMQPIAGNAKGIVLALPGYLQPAQAAVLARLGRSTVIGSAPTLLTAALAGHVEQFWQRSVLVVDVDEHALTLGWVKAMADRANLVESRSFTQLGLRVWKERLLNVLADLCVHQHRRDPRDAPMAEQSLYDQIDSLTDAASKHQAIQLGVQGQQWFMHLLVHPEQPAHFCAGLARQVAHEAEQLLVCWPASELPRQILLTHQAGRLPGLADALRALLVPSSSAETRLPSASETNYHDDDFGEDLLFADETEERGGILVLPPDAPARAAHGLAELFANGSLQRGHLESIAPLTTPPPASAGPPRLHVLGRDYFLRDAGFAIGTQYGCQLHFERGDHPEVAQRHCEISRDQRGYILHNVCREGTLLNDVALHDEAVLRAGDRIRLGPRGPLLRFLGTPRPHVIPVSV